MASGLITSWEIDGETVETVSDFILGSSKITADGDCSHEMKRRLLLGRKVMTNLDSIFKSRDISLPTKVCLVKAMVFPLVMYGCESWTVKKAEGRRIDAFEWWCWRRLLSPLDCKEVQPVHPKGDQSWVPHWVFPRLIPVYPASRASGEKVLNTTRGQVKKRMLFKGLGPWAVSKVPYWWMKAQPVDLAA